MFDARTKILFPDAEDYFVTILDALEAHLLPVRRKGPGSAVAGKKEEITLIIRDGLLEVSIHCTNKASLNSLRYAVTSLIDFNARDAAPKITWIGDTTGDTLPSDLQVLQVVKVEKITPRMRRIWFAGDNLAPYDTLKQLHSRLFFKNKHGIPTQWPLMTDEGRIRWPEGEAKLDSRVYTIRRVNLAAGQLAIDFFLGDHLGPATTWAQNAELGDGVGFIGPAALGMASARFHVFVGDETGLSGIARCLESLDQDAKGVALIEVSGPDEKQELMAPPGLTLRWLYRDGAAPGTTQLLATAFAEINWPTDRKQCAFWCGAEYDAFCVLRRAARDLGLPRENIVAFAHWRNGMNEPDIAAAGSSAIRD